MFLSKAMDKRLVIALEKEIKVRQAAFRKLSICKDLDKEIPEQPKMTEQDERIQNTLEKADFGCQHESVVKLTEAIIGHELPEKNPTIKGIDVIQIPSFVLIHIKENEDFNEGLSLVMGYYPDEVELILMSCTKEKTPYLWTITDFDKIENFFPATEEQVNEFFRNLKKKRL